MACDAFMFDATHGIDVMRAVALLQVDPISFADFETAFRIIRPSVAPDSLRRYTLWSEEYGIRG